MFYIDLVVVLFLKEYSSSHYDKSLSKRLPKLRRHDVAKEGNEATLHSPLIKNKTACYY